MPLQAEKLVDKSRIYGHTLTSLNAQLVELVDTLDLGSSAYAWGFESLTGHHSFRDLSYYFHYQSFFVLVSSS